MTKKLFLGYLVWATLGAVVDISLLYLLTELAGWWYFYGAAVGYLGGMITNYTLNKYLNFKNSDPNIARQFSLFALVATVGLVINQAVIYLLVEFAGLWYLIAKALALVVVVTWSFYGHKNITFRTDG